MGFTNQERINLNSKVLQADVMDALSSAVWFESRLFAGKVVSAQLLMQPENAFTLWHLEPGDNFFVLSKGVKTWWLAHPLYTASFRPRVKTSTNYTGTNIDVREGDEVLASRGYGAYLKVPKTKVTVRPGDVLRVPNHWWHTAVTHPGSYTLAATIRADTMPNRVGPGYFLLRKLDPQYHQIVRDYIQDGRIHDRHIGFPRKTRGASADAESATGS